MSMTKERLAELQSYAEEPMRESLEDELLECLAEIEELQQYEKELLECMAIDEGELLDALRIRDKYRDLLMECREDLLWKGSTDLTRRIDGVLK